MVWKQRGTIERVQVEVDLSDFDTGQLLQELIDRQIIESADAEKLLAREKITVQGTAISPNDEICLARSELAIGRRSEALIHIERALGNDFIGRLA
ncbi:hypothetical protein [Ancylobacter mangrovi]|uniref:Uncharacterized protein n=1 Tax=Ancylobacter mangrovi TaxID=2972472 RepID=A0A9X2T629_9HYPH|nr:hypothetical protein [Ancylobacter mangrovi]MCS0497901.1 hypothetical protein [Ancylobacter mangrovi]MCS0501580.1 hypothetical protein [Ancylobacter mangrovi]